MIRKIEDLKDGVIGFHASGVVTKEDYTEIIIPEVEKTLKTHNKLNVLYVLDEDFDHYAWQALFEDTKIGVMHPLSWEKIAIVTNVEWMLNAVKYMRPFVPFKMKTFLGTQLDDARQWIEEEEHHLIFELDKEKHLLTLEPTQALVRNDFVHLENQIEPYLSEGNTLKGVMIKTKNFPGWDSISAMKEHFMFVKAHHKQIEKLALVTDSSFLDAAQSIASVFVHPQIKEFDYNQADDALKWLLSA